jgi:hypothetical protein
MRGRRFQNSCNTGGRGHVPIIESRDRILGRHPDKSLKSFPPCYSQSHLCSFALRFLFSSNSRNLLRISTVKLLYTVKDKGGKSDRKPYLLPYGFRNTCRNLKSENFQDYAQKPLTKNCRIMNSASADGRRSAVQLFVASVPLIRPVSQIKIALSRN